jgi:hypothetical protein
MDIDIYIEIYLIENAIWALLYNLDNTWLSSKFGRCLEIRDAKLA